MKTEIHSYHAAILKVLGTRRMTAALIASKLDDGKTGSDVHNLCYRMIRDGLIERDHNGAQWVYSKKAAK